MMVRVCARGSMTSRRNAHSPIAAVRRYQCGRAQFRSEWHLLVFDNETADLEALAVDYDAAHAGHREIRQQALARKSRPLTRSRRLSDQPAIFPASATDASSMEERRQSRAAPPADWRSSADTFRGRSSASERAICSCVYFEEVWLRRLHVTGSARDRPPAPAVDSRWCRGRARTRSAARRTARS